MLHNLIVELTASAWGYCVELPLLHSYLVHYCSLRTAVNSSPMSATRSCVYTNQVCRRRRYLWVDLAFMANATLAALAMLESLWIKTWRFEACWRLCCQRKASHNGKPIHPIPCRKEAHDKLRANGKTPKWGLLNSLDTHSSSIFTVVSESKGLWRRQNFLCILWLQYESSILHVVLPKYS